MLNALTTKAYIKATEAFRSFKNNEAGVIAIEYGLIAVAVALMIVAVFYNDQGRGAHGGNPPRPRAGRWQAQEFCACGEAPWSWAS